MRHAAGPIARLLLILLVPAVSAACSAQEQPQRMSPPQALQFASTGQAAAQPATPPTPATPATPATAGTVGRFPFLTVDATRKQIRVECEALHVEAPLEFFCCVAGTNEHEAVLRSKVRPSHLHAALLMLGLQPGEPVHFSQAAQKWIPPHGPPLHITVEFEKDGKPVSIPAYRLMRDIKTKRPMPPLTWIFAGSRMMPSGDGGGETYAADRTGYLVSVVNFEFTVIDIPELASNANETLEWETDLSAMPPKGSKVTMVIEPAGLVAAPGPATRAAAAAAALQAAPGPIDQPLVTIDAAGKIALDATPVASADELVRLLNRTSSATRRVRVAVANPIEENATAREVVNGLAAAGIRFTAIPQATAAGLMPAQPAAQAASTAATTAAAAGVDASADLRVNDDLIRRLRAKWDQAVAPHDAELREAAKTHYEVISQLRREQQRLIDEADKVQRLIDQLEKQYQDMTTPKPE